MTYYFVFFCPILSSFNLQFLLVLFVLRLDSAQDSSLAFSIFLFMFPELNFWVFIILLWLFLRKVIWKTYLLDLICLKCLAYMYVCICYICFCSLQDSGWKVIFSQNCGSSASLYSRGLVLFFSSVSFFFPL